MNTQHLDTTRWVLNRINKGLPVNSNAFKRFKSREQLDDCKYHPPTKKVNIKTKILFLLKSLESDMLLSQNLLDNLKEFGYVNLYDDIKNYLIDFNGYIKECELKTLESYGYVIAIDYNKNLLSIAIKNHSLNISGVKKCQQLTI